MAVLTSGFRFSIITACRFSNGRNRNDGINWTRSRMRDLIVDATISPISPPFRFFFPRSLRFESGGQSPGRIFKRVEILDSNWKYPDRNAEQMPYFVVDSLDREKCRIILIRVDSRVNAKRETFWQVCSFFLLFDLDRKEASVRYSNCIVSVCWWISNLFNVLNIGSWESFNL